MTLRTVGNDAPGVAAKSIRQPAARTMLLGIVCSLFVEFYFLRPYTLVFISKNLVMSVDAAAISWLVTHLQNAGCNLSASSHIYLLFVLLFLCLFIKGSVTLLLSVSPEAHHCSTADLQNSSCSTIQIASTKQASLPNDVMYSRVLKFVKALFGILCLLDCASSW